MRALPLALLLGALACGGAGAEPEEVPAPTPVGGETPRDEVEVEREVPGLARALGPTATFTDLVAAARRLDDRGEGASDAGCLLRGSGEADGAWRLEAELAVALRPLPEPGAALARRAARGRPFRLLSRWGRRGDAEGLTLVAFTDAPPPPAGPLGALLLTEAGVHALRSDRALAGAPAPLEGWALPEALDGVTQLVVSADAGTPLARLRRLLAALPEAASRDVVLAVPLPEDVRLPDAPSPADADDLLCGEEGLPASSRRRSSSRRSVPSTRRRAPVSPRPPPRRPRGAGSCSTSASAPMGPSRRPARARTTSATRPSAAASSRA